VINQKINRATFDYNTALADQSFDHQTQLNDQGFDHSRRLNNQSYNQNRRLNEQNHGFNRELQDADNASREVIATMDANTRLQINQDTLNAQERAETARLMQEADRTYQQTISSISQNPDLPATERARLTQNALDVRNSSQTMVQNLYDVKLDWSSKSSGSGSSGTGSSGTGSTGSTSSRSSNAGSGTSGSIPSGLSPIQGLMYGTAQRLAYEKGRAR
jgi:hypothetical protein